MEHGERHQAEQQWRDVDLGHGQADGQRHQQGRDQALEHGEAIARPAGGGGLARAGRPRWDRGHG
jgi:hypothetical protein